MAGVNKVIVLGRLGKDPESKMVGQNTCTIFSVATSETWMKDGQKQEKTEWHNIVVWGKPAEAAAKYLSKGKQVYVEGKLQTRSWDTKEGTKAYKTEIVAQSVQFLGDSGGGGAKASDPGPVPPENSFGGYADDEMPL
jgi:single-strand DNA-binding protein